MSNITPITFLCIFSSSDVGSTNIDLKKYFELLVKLSKWKNT